MLREVWDSLGTTLSEKLRELGFIIIISSICIVEVASNLFK